MRRPPRTQTADNTPRQAPAARTDGPDGRPDGLFIAESVLVVARALAAPALDVRTVVVTPHGYRRLAAELETVAARTGPRPGPAVLIVAPELLRTVAGFEVHRGVLAAIARPPERSVAEVLAGAGPLVAVVEGVNDQENLGALFRNASALGASAVLLCPRCCDPLYRRTVRVSMGEVLFVPWARLAPWPDGLAQVRAAGYVVEALMPNAERSISARTGGERVAVLVGSEGTGLSPEAAALADRRVRIPMRPGVDSLNVAVAAAIAFHVHAAYDPR